MIVRVGVALISKRASCSVIVGVAGSRYASGPYTPFDPQLGISQPFLSLCDVHSSPPEHMLIQKLSDINVVIFIAGYVCLKESSCPNKHNLVKCLDSLVDQWSKEGVSWNSISSLGENCRQGRSSTSFRRNTQSFVLWKRRPDNIFVLQESPS